MFSSLHSLQLHVLLEKRQFFVLNQRKKNLLVRTFFLHRIPNFVGKSGKGRGLSSAQEQISDKMDKYEHVTKPSNNLLKTQGTKNPEMYTSLEQVTPGRMLIENPQPYVMAVNNFSATHKDDISSTSSDLEAPVKEELTDTTTAKSRTSATNLGKVDPSDQENLVFINAKNEVIMNKRVADIWKRPLRKWNQKEEVLSFLHISKCGGTSMKASLREAKLKNGCNLSCQDPRKAMEDQNRTCPLQTCTGHFDWTRIRNLNKTGVKTAPIIIIRNPIETFLSNFYFTKFRLARNLSEAHKEIKNMSVAEYLNNPDVMWKTRSLWYDGTAATSWLAGTNLESYVVGKLGSEEVSRRDLVSANWTYMLNTAIENLHKCLWVGILDEIDRSFEMLKYQTGLEMKMQHLNTRFSNGRNDSYPKLNPFQEDFLKKLMPMDMFVYEYAKQLHNFRWVIYKNPRNETSNSKQIRLQLPRILSGCKSTSQSISCPSTFKAINTIFQKYVTKRW